MNRDSSVWQLATCWMIWGKNPDWTEIFRISPDLYWGPPNPPVKLVTAFFSGIIRPVFGVFQAPNIAPRLKEV